MDVNVATKQNAQVVTIVGEIDGSSAPQAQAVILAQVGEGAKVVLDMTGVTYMSSAGLRVLLLLYRQAVARNGRVALAGVAAVA